MKSLARQLPELCKAGGYIRILNQILRYSSAQKLDKVGTEPGEIMAEIQSTFVFKFDNK